jgi:hypothetical protein
MVNSTNNHTRKTSIRQESETVIPKPVQIGASTPYDFQGSNMTAYGGLLLVATMLEKLQFQQLIEEHVTIKRLTTSMPGFRFVLAMVLALRRLFAVAPYAILGARADAYGDSGSERIAGAEHVLAIPGVAASGGRAATAGYKRYMGGRWARAKGTIRCIGEKSYQCMSSEGWCIQWESTPPEQKSEFCSWDSREGRKLNPGSLSTKPSLGW